MSHAKYTINHEYEQILSRVTPWKHPDLNLEPCWEVTFMGQGRTISKQKITKVARWVLGQKEHSDLGRLIVARVCGNDRCVRPDHLYAGTHKDKFQGRGNMWHGDKNRSRLPDPVYAPSPSVENLCQAIAEHIGLNRTSE